MDDGFEGGGRLFEEEDEEGGGGGDVDESISVNIILVENYNVEGVGGRGGVW